ncbi:hypothetical protein [Paenibacillus aceti]|uniref:Limonene hydroxylase n=1 Tax=Paenibacillus aceti TaxID=1820010 RepID=A0ABQ1W8I4_9BACL|nr:hypothetical protein [Paenibacillus aceti]GGG16586.1 hypothetical protein GCM10010913_43290 [Paenibacillus aceti]
MKQALTLKFIDVGGEESLSQYKQIIQASIKKYADRHGVVAYGDEAYAVTGAQRVMDKAYEAIQKGEQLQAAEILFLVFDEMRDLLGSCHDPDGDVEVLIEDCLDSIHDISVELGNSDSKEREILFKRLLEESVHPVLEGRSEWGLSFLDDAINVMATDAEIKLWSALLDDMENKNGTTYSTYFSRHAAELKYKAVQKFEGVDSATEFIQKHLDMPEFREKAIKAALDNQSYDKALELVKQGEQIDAEKKLPGLVHKWKVHRYEIYRLAHQLEQQKQLAEELALEEDYSYYLILKGLYDQDAWPAVYEGFLNKLKDKKGGRTSGFYTAVLVEEGDNPRLMEYVRNNAWAVVNYYPYLVEDYTEEVFQWFTQVITEAAANATKRKQYQEVCKKIHTLIQAGGTDPARKLLKQLRGDYSNRPAFLDELERVDTTGIGR